MKGVVLIYVLICSCRAFDPVTDREWEHWTRQFNKHYVSPEEESARKQIWLHNLQLVEEHNNKPGVTFHMGLNQFADQTPTNRSKFYVPYTGVNSIYDATRVPDLPPSFDWRVYKVVPPVRDQGEIGSALGFAATDAVESYTAIHSGQLYNLSVVEFDQCCNTHLLGSEFECIHKMGGLCLARDYNKTSTCNAPLCKQIAQIDGGQNVKSGDENDLQLAVLITPVLVALDASHPSFQLYTGGIYNEPSCSSTMLDHVMLLVGYGSNAGNDYWICKNSWGKAWGMNGYILMSRNKNNQCGIATNAAYPV